MVDAASIIFLITFGTVNMIAFIQKIRFRWIALAGVVLSGSAVVLSIYQQIQSRPVPLIILLAIIVLALVGRPFVLKRINGNKNQS